MKKTVAPVTNVGNLSSMKNMKLNQEIESECFRIKRVPGGWLYSRYCNPSVHSVFVSEPKE